MTENLTSLLGTTSSCFVLSLFLLLLFGMYVTASDYPSRNASLPLFVSCHFLCSGLVLYRRKWHTIVLFVFPDLITKSSFLHSNHTNFRCQLSLLRTFYRHNPLRSNLPKASFAKHHDVSHRRRPRFYPAYAMRRAY